MWPPISLTFTALKDGFKLNWGADPDQFPPVGVPITGAAIEYKVIDEDDFTEVEYDTPVYEAEITFNNKDFRDKFLVVRSRIDNQFGDGFWSDPVIGTVLGAPNNSIIGLGTSKIIYSSRTSSVRPFSISYYSDDRSQVAISFGAGTGTGRVYNLPLTANTFNINTYESSIALPQIGTRTFKVGVCFHRANNLWYTMHTTGARSRFWLRTYNTSGRQVDALSIDNWDLECFVAGADTLYAVTTNNRLRKFTSNTASTDLGKIGGLGSIESVWGATINNGSLWLSILRDPYFKGYVHNRIAEYNLSTLQPTGFEVFLEASAGSATANQFAPIKSFIIEPETVYAVTQNVDVVLTPSPLQRLNIAL